MEYFNLIRKKAGLVTAIEYAFESMVEANHPPDDMFFEDEPRYHSTSSHNGLEVQRTQNGRILAMFIRR